MRIFAIALLFAGAARAQDEARKETRAAVALTDAQAAELGGFVADKVDSNLPAEELERAIVEKVDNLQKASGTTVEKKEDPAPARGKGKKKAGKKTAKRGSNTTGPQAIKNGLTDSDRTAFGKFVLAEIHADHKGQALFDAVKKELERVRAERVKASSAADSTPAKRKKKKANG